MGTKLISLSEKVKIIDEEEGNDNISKNENDTLPCDTAAKNANKRYLQLKYLP